VYSQSSRFSPQSAGITGVYHHTQPQEVSRSNDLRFRVLKPLLMRSAWHFASDRYIIVEQIYVEMYISRNPAHLCCKCHGDLFNQLMKDLVLNFLC
jgi:hypothetical protein